MATGKFTKRWQYRASRFKYKTRQPQPVARRALQLHHGVRVPSQHRMGGVCLRMVASGKGADQVGLVHNADAQRWGRVTGPAVVVAAHQCATKAGVALPPKR